MDYRHALQAKDKGHSYDKDFKDRGYLRFVWEWEKAVLKKAFIEHTQTKNPVILDFACGTGRILTLLENHSKSVTGVDVSESMLGQAKNKITHAKLLHGDITKNEVEFQAAQFDVITAFRFFLNAQDSLRNEALEKFQLYLKSNGIFVFNIHANATHPGVLAAQSILWLKNRFRGEKPTQNGLSILRMKRLLNEYNFQIIRVHHRNIIPIINENTNIPLSKFKRIEDFSSKVGFLRHLSRNIIFVCKKK